MNNSLGVADSLASPTGSAKADGAIANVLVYVKEGLPEGKEYPPPAEPVVVDQVGCRYTPHVVALAEAAYRAGARLVEPIYDDLRARRAKLQYARDEHLGVRRDIVSGPVLHDTLGEISQPRGSLRVSPFQDAAPCQNDTFSASACSQAASSAGRAACRRRRAAARRSR